MKWDSSKCQAWDQPDLCNKKKGFKIAPLYVVCSIPEHVDRASPQGIAQPVEGVQPDDGLDQVQEGVRLVQSAKDAREREEVVGKGGHLCDEDDSNNYDALCNSKRLQFTFVVGIILFLMCSLSSNLSMSPLSR